MFRQLGILLLVVLTQQGCLADWHFTGPDVALRMVAVQGPGTFLNYVAGLAVDGYHDSNLEDNHCSHTDEQMGGWWKVELPDSFYVKGVCIYNRFHHPERLEDFRVVGNPGNVELYNDRLVPEGSKLYLNAVINIPVNADQAFGRIEVNIPGPYLTMCEVEVHTELCELPKIHTGSALKFKYTGKTYQNDYVHVGSQLYFHCDPPSMYLMVGNDTLTCLADGTYSSDLPKCVKYCPPPPPIENGNYSDERTNYIPGDTIWIECIANFSSLTDTEQICTSFSEWSVPYPKCSMITCPRPAFLTHGYYLFNNGSKFIFGNVDVGTTVSVVCDEGFVSPHPELQCASSGDWTGIGECLDISSINCSLDLLQPDEHHYVLDKNYGDTIRYNELINATCKPGYERESGDSVRQCLADQSLSGAELQCSAQPNKADKTTNTIAIVGGAVGSAVVIAAVVILFFLRKRLPCFRQGAPLGGQGNQAYGRF